MGSILKRNYYSIAQAFLTLLLCWKPDTNATPSQHFQWSLLQWQITQDRWEFVHLGMQLLHHIQMRQ